MRLGVTAPLRTNIIPLTAVWNPSPFRFPPPLKVPDGSEVPEETPEILRNHEMLEIFRISGIGKETCNEPWVDTAQTLSKPPARRVF